MLLTRGRVLGRPLQQVLWRLDGGRGREEFRNRGRVDFLRSQPRAVRPVGPLDADPSHPEYLMSGISRVLYGHLVVRIRLFRVFNFNDPAFPTSFV